MITSHSFKSGRVFYNLAPLSYQCASFGEQFQFYTNFQDKHVGEIRLDNGVYPHREVPCYYSPDTTKLSDVDFIILDDFQISMADS